MVSGFSAKVAGILALVVTMAGCPLATRGQSAAFDAISVREVDTSAARVMASTNMYLHVLSTGQSVSAGFNSAPAISTTQPYGNLSLSSSPAGYAIPLRPLTEVGGEETPSSGIANNLHVLDSLSRAVIVSLHGVPGYGYDSLKKGSNVWNTFLLQVNSAKAQVHSIDSTAIYVPIGVTVIHGETDFFTHNTANYKGYLVHWQRDYQHDISAILGHSFPFPMFLSQMNTGWSGEMAIAQYEAHKENPRRIIMIGPKYQYTHQSDHMHLLNAESKHLGEMFAKVINEVVLKRKVWNPLMPTGIYRVGNVVTIDYHIPVGELAIDTTLVARRPHYGFEFLQTGGNNVTITNVALIHSNTQVQITLDTVPTGIDQKIRYACTCYHNATQGLGWCGGSRDSTAVGGNLRDTDSLPSRAIGSSGIPLYDWGVAFEEPVTERLVSVGEPPASTLQVFPNPAQSSFQVRLAEKLKSIQGLELIDLSGRAVRVAGNAEGGSEAFIAIDGVVPGLYLLTVKVAGRADAIVKVVVE